MSKHIPVILDDDDDHEHVVNLRGRSLRRTLLIAALVAAAALAATATRASAADDVAAGQATMTSQAGCPEGLILNLAMVDRGADWLLELHPVHPGCAIRTDLPMEFAGSWDPSGATLCGEITGHGCFRPTSGAPGLLGIGAVPDAGVLTETTIVFRRGMLRLEGRVVIRRSVTSASRAEPVQLAGVGEVTPPGCATGAYKMPFTLTNDGGPLWVLSRPAAIGAACPALVHGGPVVLTGSFNATEGGCLVDRTGAKACLGPMPNRGVTNGISFTWCSDAVQCFHGEAWLMRA